MYYIGYFKNLYHSCFANRKELLDFCHDNCLTPEKVVYFKDDKCKVGYRIMLLPARNKHGWKLGRIK